MADPAGIPDEQLLRFADNVFVGRVIRQSGYEPPSKNFPPFPESLFAVEVEKSIKGSLSGTVTVVQGAAVTPGTVAWC